MTTQNYNILVYIDGEDLIVFDDEHEDAENLFYVEKEKELDETIQSLATRYNVEVLSEQKGTDDYERVYINMDLNGSKKNVRKFIRSLPGYIEHEMGETG